MQNKIFIPIFLIAVFVVGAILYVYNPEPVEYKNPNEPEETACTLEAMLCPDGSYVGRSGPNCEFAPCPIPEGAIMEDGTIIDGDDAEPVFCAADAKLCPDGSYVGRSGPNCEFVCP